MNDPKENDLLGKTFDDVWTFEQEMEIEKVEFA
jgi:hypothetical protein